MISLMREITILTESTRMLNTGVISNVDMQTIMIRIGWVKNNSHLIFMLSAAATRAQKTPHKAAFLLGLAKRSGISPVGFHPYQSVAG